jgi:hypothetical protein
MSKTNSFEEAMLDHIFLNSGLPNIGDSVGLASSTPQGSLYISLHTGDPTETGDQGTNEAAYSPYARVAAGRTGEYWNRTANTVINVTGLIFPQATGGTETITHFGIGVSGSGANLLLYATGVDTPLAVSSGVTPQFLSGNITVQEI